MTDLLFTFATSFVGEIEFCCKGWCGSSAPNRMAVFKLVFVVHSCNLESESRKYDLNLPVNHAQVTPMKV